MSFQLMQDRLARARAFGAVEVPGSKSVTNRALILASLAPGRSHLRGGLEAEDTAVLRESLRRLGVPLSEDLEGWTIQGGGPLRAEAPLPVGASGTTLRFLLPTLALHACGPVRLQGDPRLFARPLGPLLQVLEALGARWHPGADGGVLHPVPRPPRRLEARIDASGSSQFLSGLALAGAALPGGAALRWEGPAASPSYLDLSRRWMEAFHCPSRLEPGRWEIPGGALRPAEPGIPGDWSGAAAFLCAATVSGRRIRISPLDPLDPQGDRELLAILESAGSRGHWEGDTLHLEGALLRGLEADLGSCPDLAPVLAATSARAPGPSRLAGLQTLPHKECDRLEASVNLVRWLGGEARVEGTTLHVRPGPRRTPQGPFDPRNDHRMAFAAAVGALACGGLLRNPFCVGKSFPGFWEAWEAMLRGAP